MEEIKAINPIIETVLAHLRYHKLQKQAEQERRDFQVKLQRFKEKWTSLIQEDARTQGISFKLEIDVPLSMAIIGDDDQEEERPLTKPELIKEAVVTYLTGGRSWDLRKRCREFARRISKKIIPSTKVVSNFLKRIGRTSLDPDIFINWLWKAWDYDFSSAISDV